LNDWNRGVLQKDTYYLYIDGKKILEGAKIENIFNTKHVWEHLKKTKDSCIVQAGEHLRTTETRTTRCHAWLQPNPTSVPDSPFI